MLPPHVCTLHEININDATWVIESAGEQMITTVKKQSGKETEASWWCDDVLVFNSCWPSKSYRRPHCTLPRLPSHLGQCDALSGANNAFYTDREDQSAAAATQELGPHKIIVCVTFSCFTFSVPLCPGCVMCDDTIIMFMVVMRL